MAMAVLPCAMSRPGTNAINFPFLNVVLLLETELLSALKPVMMEIPLKMTVVPGDLSMQITRALALLPCAPIIPSTVWVRFPTGLLVL